MIYGHYKSTEMSRNGGVIVQEDVEARGSAGPDAALFSPGYCSDLPESEHLTLLHDLLWVCEV